MNALNTSSLPSSSSSSSSSSTSTSSAFYTVSPTVNSIKMNLGTNDHSDSATSKQQNSTGSGFATDDVIGSPIDDIEEMEDLKTDIPYFDDTLNTDAAAAVAAATTESGAEASTPHSVCNENFLAKSELNDDPLSSIGDYSQWDDADDQYLDDNGSVMGSEYASTTYTSSSTSAAAAYQELQQQQQSKYMSPNSNYHFSHHYAAQPVTSPHMPTLTQQPSSGATATPPSPMAMSMHGYSQALHQTPGQLVGHGVGGSSGFYPNMWYPNAPYGTGGGGGGGVGGSVGGNVGGVVGGGVGVGGVSANNTNSPGGNGSANYCLPYGPPHHRCSGFLSSYNSIHPQQTQHHQHPHDTMMEMFQLVNSGREARNRAEKNRRDKLNGSIQELSTMVPHVAESPRRVDKTAVLRFAAHGLRLKYVFGKTLNQQHPQLTDTLMNMLDSFFLTLTCHGQILLISSSVEQHLGHCQADLYGQNILHITHPEDQNMLKQQLIPTDLENLFDVHPTDTDENGEPRQRSDAEEDYIDRRLREDKRSFRVRLARAGPRSEPTAYEVVKIDGCFRRSDEAPRGVKTNTFSTSLQLIRRTRGRDDAIPLHTISGNDIVLTARARIIRPPKIINRLVDANTLEYRTRHLIDGRIIDCDQRIGLVAGYMTDEVLNLSPFTFMHNDDVRWVIVALRQMYDCNSSYGESTYRLFTRNGSIIYLQSKGYLEIDKKTNEVHSFVCVNTLLDEEEGKRRVQEMKKKFSVIVNTKIPQSTVDVPASENPQQLEKAVLCLIQNLQKSTSDEDDDNSDNGLLMTEYANALINTSSQLQTKTSTEQQQLQHQPHCVQHQRSSNQLQDHKPQMLPPDLNTDEHMSQNSTTTQSSQQSSHGKSAPSAAQRHLGDLTGARFVTGSKTPPLALVPPEASSVKSSISKSVSVVNVTAAKHLRNVQQQRNVKSPLPNACSCQQSTDQHKQRQQQSDSVCEFCCQSHLTSEATTTMLKRSGLSVSDTTDGVKSPKRRLADIEHALGSSIVEIGRTLNQQLNAVIELRDKHNKFELPNSSQNIDEIMEEHQKQSEIFVNIKSEFEVQIQNNKANTTKAESEPTASQDNSDELRPR